MISKVLAVPSTITVTTANNARRAFIATSLLQTPNTPHVVPDYRGKNVAKRPSEIPLTSAFAMSPPCLIAYQMHKEDDYRKLKDAACWNLKETAYQTLKEID